MRRRRLGNSAITVSEICLGTMTFGSQASTEESFRMIDRAVECGVDFFDLAELYPVPPKAEWAGRTEEIVGQWLKDKPRESLILATKIAGPGHGWFTPPIRFGKTALDQKQVFTAVEGSLKRLGTDYIDLYQTHWPDHGMPYEEVLGALTKLIDQGKVRAIGCSNETSWGVMKSLWAAEKHGTARYVSVQNNFSLINRRCESELAQVCRRESVSLLPYSPLGGGVLSGKYLQGAPLGSRFYEYIHLGQPRQKAMAARFVNPRTVETAQRVAIIAKDLGISPVTLAIAWSKQHDFVASTIIGATTVSQLNESLLAADMILDAETMQRIDQIEIDIPNAMTEDGLRRL